MWLCIDGSNDDCRSTGVDIAEKGHAKSHKNVNIVSFTYAITNDGLPVTFEIYRGGLVDAKAMKKILDFLAECGISLRGVILDRGYCDRNTLKYLNSHSIPYSLSFSSNNSSLLSDLVRSDADPVTRQNTPRTVSGSS
ncbi:MAG: hypothetical protein IJ682_10660 [Lachnospiraceae bacterium]|nr:hypothetical protein [Lachnospiraceae bacterium]